jgi:ParB/RepB/Spo0J family partition protein
MANPNPVKEVTMFVPLSNIFVDHSWNSRSGGWLQESSELPKKGEAGPGETTGLAGLIASIKAKGQIQAVHVRPNPKGKQEYMLVTGFQRFEALRRIAEMGVDVPGSPSKNPCIKADIRNLSEAEARELNGIENLERRNLSTADTAWHISMLAAIAEQSGVKKTDTEIALQIGLTQSYVSKLHRIMKETGADILKSWRENPVDPLTVDQRLAVAYEKDGKVRTKADQEEVFKKLLEGAGEKKKTGGWMPKAKENAAKLGVVFGVLEREGVVALNGRKGHLLLPTFGPKYIGAKKPTDKQWETLRDSFDEGREMGMKAPEPEAEKPEKAERAAAAQ